MRPGDPTKKFWLRVGSAFVNRDQSLTVRLDATPCNGTLHIRDYEPPPEGGPRRRDEPSHLRNPIGIAHPLEGGF